MIIIKIILAYGCRRVDSLATPRSQCPCSCCNSSCLSLRFQILVSCTLNDEWPVCWRCLVCSGSRWVTWCLWNFRSDSFRLLRWRHHRAAGKTQPASRALYCLRTQSLHCFWSNRSRNRCLVSSRDWCYEWGRSNGAAVDFESVQNGLYSNCARRWVCHLFLRQIFCVAAAADVVVDDDDGETVDPRCCLLASGNGRARK